MRQKAYATTRRPLGFTLIEMLVTTAIISVLAAVLLPSLSAARQSAYSAQCLSNLRQMASAAYQYTHIHNGHFIPYKYNPRNNITYQWDYIIDNNGPEPSYRAGLLWPKNVELAIYQCPVPIRNSNPGEDEPYTGYNYNTSFIGFFMARQSGLDFSTMPPTPTGPLVVESETIRIDRVRDPSNTALFGDGEWYDPADGLYKPNRYMRSPLPGRATDLDDVYRYTGTQGYRHNQRTNVAWVDGHASSMIERHTTNAAGTPIGEGVGFLSEDNRLYDLE